MILYEDDTFLLKAKNDIVYIIVEEHVYNIRKFSNIIDIVPRIFINNFLYLKKALDEANGTKVNVGLLKPEVEVFISSSNMICEVKVNFTDKYIKENADTIREKIIKSLDENNIEYGIDNKVLDNGIISCEKFIVAKGLAPTDGEDAVIKYFIKPRKKIEVKSDGKTDYYNLNLIDTVEKDDWLGEKIIPKTGKKGYNIKGELLEPTLGNEEFLLYDEESIKLSVENEKMVLRALHDGAVIFKNNKIHVQDHLIIEEDVDRVVINYINGKIISGNVYAKSQVVSGSIGNMSERETNINVDGFDRDKLKKELKETLSEYKNLLIHLEVLKVNLKNSEDESDCCERLKKYENLIEELVF